MKRSRKILVFAVVCILLVGVFLLLRETAIGMWDSLFESTAYHLYDIDTAHIDRPYDTIDLRDPSITAEEFLASVSPQRHDSFYAFVVSVDAEADPIAQAYQNYKCISYASASKIDLNKTAYFYDAEYSVGGSYRVFRLADSDSERNRYLLFEQNMLSADIQVLLQQLEKSKTE